MAHVRLPATVYDAYCRKANAAKVSLNAVLKQALTRGISESNK